MASTKNVQALNNRLELACRNRVGEFYRQHISSMAQLEHDKLDTARLLQAVKKCPSNSEALSIKFLGPPPKSSHQQQRRDRAAKEQRNGVGQKPAVTALKPAGEGSAPPPPEEPSERKQQRAPPQTAAPVSENPFAPPPSQQLQQLQHLPQQIFPIERSKTYAVDSSEPNRGARQQRQSSQRQRSRTPFPNKLERFYTHLEDTKRSCGLLVVDSTQTAEAREFRGTLTRAEWRAKLAKLDPEYFKNLANEDTESESESDQS